MLNSIAEFIGFVVIILFGGLGIVILIAAIGYVFSYIVNKIHFGIVMIKFLRVNYSAISEYSWEKYGRGIDKKTFAKSMIGYINEDPIKYAKFYMKNVRRS